MIAAVALLAAAALYDQAVARALADRFRGASYVLVDAGSGALLSARWPDMDRPVPAGSLVKAFVAMAGAPPRAIVCRAGECWLPGGHGAVNLSQAIAHSCNAFFLRMAASAGRDSIAAAAVRFGMPAPPVGTSAAELIGMRGEWKAAPLAAATAFASLLRAPDSGAVREGMRRAAREGTARRIGPGALAKTGTAACSHARRGQGDGLVIAAFPAGAPRYVLLVRMHNTTGAAACATAAAMIEVIRGAG